MQKTATAQRFAVFLFSGLGLCDPIAIRGRRHERESPAAPDSIRHPTHDRIFARIAPAEIP